jgi:ubiquinone/menaquinone biosynthesis C-methylase UbiE
MEAKLMRRVQRGGWDRAASCYEQYWGEQIAPAVTGLLAAAALRPGEDVLDTACGTGLVTLPAAAAVGPGGRVLATDLAPRMVASLDERVAAAGLVNVTTEVVGAEALDHDGEFDVALCGLGLMYVPDPAAALAAMHRALRPGGRVAVSVWGERRRCGWAGIFPIVDARVSSDVCPLFFALGNPGALRATLERAGFTDVAERRLSVELAYTSGAAALGAAFDGGPVALAAARFDDAVRAAADAEYLASIAPFADGAGYRVPGEFVVASGRRP